MTKLEIHNPFGAPVYHIETVTSTMDVSRELAARGEPSGTVIAADFQEKGRGRIRDRKWEMERGNLPFTILLRYPGIEVIPQALTLRAGLAAALAIEDFCPSLKNIVMIKWPNDLFIGSKKTAGILAEADGGNVHAGIGINFAQKIFPDHLREKATSVALAAGRDFSPCDRFSLLEKVLVRLHAELETADWRDRIQQRLYKKGEQVVFVEGAAGSKNSITGSLAGIGQGGELLIVPDGEKEAQSFVTGELLQPIP